MVRVVCLSDTHNQHWDISVPEGDILIHAGDFSFRGLQRELLDFNDWLRHQRHTHKILIPGNHDVSFETDFATARALVSAADHVLIEQGIELEGVKIWGSPYTPEFHGWAFQIDPSEGKRRWSGIPEGLDILVTHGPPKFIFDLTARGVNAGCRDLLKAVQLKKPKHHVFGHIHEYGSRSMAVDGVCYHNVAMLDEQYRRLDKKPLVLDF